MGDPKNHIVAIELDTKVDQQFEDNANHVGIDINSLVSDRAAYKDDGTFRNLSLNSGHPMQVWIEYDSKQKQLSDIEIIMIRQKKKEEIITNQLHKITNQLHNYI